MFERMIAAVVSTEAVVAALVAPDALAGEAQNLRARAFQGDWDRRAGEDAN